MHVVNGNVTPEFSRLMVQIAEGYPTTGNLSEGTIRIYAWALGEYSVKAIYEACLRLFRDGSGFFPSTVEILRALGTVTGDDAALLAWAQFRQAAFDVGAYASIEVDDAYAAQALLDVFGSWHAYCAEVEGPSLAMKRKEFLAAYRVARSRLTRASGRPPRLFGLLESGTGYVASEKTVVGRLHATGAVSVGPDVSRALGPSLDIEP